MPTFLKLAVFTALAAIFMTIAPAPASAQARGGYEREYYSRESGSGGYRVRGRVEHRVVRFRAYGRSHELRPGISLRLHLRSWGYTPHPPRQAYARREPLVCSVNVSRSMFAEAVDRGWDERMFEQNLARLADGYCPRGYDDIVVNPVP